MAATKTEYTLNKKHALISKMRLLSHIYGIDSTRPAPLSMNELTTEYWNSYTNSFINIYRKLWLLGACTYNFRKNAF